MIAAVASTLQGGSCLGNSFSCAKGYDRLAQDGQGVNEEQGIDGDGVLALTTTQCRIDASGTNKGSSAGCGVISSSACAVCTLCKQEFNEEDSFQEHIASSHGDCKEQFPSSASLPDCAGDLPATRSVGSAHSDGGDRLVERAMIHGDMEEVEYGQPDQRHSANSSLLGQLYHGDVSTLSKHLQPVRNVQSPQRSPVPLAACFETASYPTESKGKRAEESDERNADNAMVSGRAMNIMATGDQFATDQRSAALMSQWSKASSPLTHVSYEQFKLDGKTLQCKLQQREAEESSLSIGTLSVPASEGYRLSGDGGSLASAGRKFSSAVDPLFNSRFGGNPRLGNGKHGSMTGPVTGQCPTASQHAKPSERVVCDICNKEVCNKYFLKTHKTRVHGIVAENRSSEAGANSSSYVGPIRHQQQAARNSSGNYNSCIGSATTSVLKCASTGGDGHLQPGVMELNDGMDLRQRSGLVAQDTCQSSFGLSPYGQQFDDQVRDGVSSPPEQPCSQQQQQVVSMSEEERMQLVQRNIDPDVYCIVCRKEFCSRHFLQIHLQSVHGGRLTRHTAGSTSSDAEIQPSAGGHLVTATAAHHEAPSGSQRRSGRREGFAHHPGGTTTKKTQSPAQTRVTCRICNKELCNKYFLRSHMMNVHNVFADDTSTTHHNSGTAGISQQQSSASSSKTVQRKSEHWGGLGPSVSSTDGKVESAIVSQGHDMLAGVMNTTSMSGKRSSLDNSMGTIDYGQLFLQSYAHLQNMIAAAQFSSGQGLYPPSDSLAHMDKSANNKGINPHSSIGQDKLSDVQPTNLSRSSNKNSDHSELLYAQYRCPLCGDCMTTCDEYSEHCRRLHSLSPPDPVPHSTDARRPEQASCPMPGRLLIPPPKRCLDNSSLSYSYEGGVAKRHLSSLNSTAGSLSDHSADVSGRKHQENTKPLLDLSCCLGRMQAFIFESDDVDFAEHFVPCVVYLPIKEHVYSNVSFKLKLRPVSGGQMATNVVSNTEEHVQNEAHESDGNGDDGLAAGDTEKPYKEERASETPGETAHSCTSELTDQSDL